MLQYVCHSCVCPSGLDSFCGVIVRFLYEVGYKASAYYISFLITNGGKTYGVGPLVSYFLNIGNIVLLQSVLLGEKVNGIGTDIRAECFYKSILAWMDSVGI